MLKDPHRYRFRTPSSSQNHSALPAQPPTTSRIIRGSKDGVLLTIHVQPKAARTGCAGIHGDALKIRIAAPPVGGAANRELIRFLADELSLPAAAVQIESGEGARCKRVRLRGTTVSHVLAHLMREESTPK